MTTLLAAAVKAAAAAPAAAKGAPISVQQVIPPSAAPQTWMQMHASWLTHGIAGIFIIAAIALVALLAVQTTKQEGLSGTIGGRVESAYGRMGAEEQLKRVTGFTAVLFVVTGFILSLTGI
ncbi:MAG TPA: preprotein translocase subunit SecG [Verrucomicrobiae bacterium]|nr:preprotein translocase subunit SecG [Verrucomicrobiae bacterium]